MISEYFDAGHNNSRYVIENDLLDINQIIY